MSDEMVQEKTETAGEPMPPEGANGEHIPGDHTAAPVSSAVVEVPATHEPAPPQVVAPPASFEPADPVETQTPTEPTDPVAADTPAEPAAVAEAAPPSADSDADAFDAAMQALDMNSQYDRSLRQLQQD